MAQADSVHSTPPTNRSANNVDPSRRGFLAKAAGVAAAATVAPSAFAMTPDDRTFALIEVHRSAEAAHVAACSEYSRRQQALIDEGIGLRPFTMLVSQGQPIAAYTHAQIDAYGDAHISAQVVARAHIDLDRALARYDEVLGNSEDEAGRHGDVAWDALYDLISSVPTTALGLRALVSYLADEVVDVAHQLQGEHLEMLLVTMSDTPLALHPAE